MEFETEEQQVEALKQWWKKNGMQVIAGAVIGFGLIIGWRYYLNYSHQQITQASALFDQIAANPESDVDAIYNKLKQDYASTSYVQAAALIQAKKAYESGDKEKSLLSLNAVIESSGNNEIGLIATERKARVLIDMGQLDEALKLLSVKVPENFVAVFEELKGDVYVAQGKPDSARTAYDKALLATVGNKDFIEMKRNNLGMTAMTDSVL